MTGQRKAVGVLRAPATADTKNNAAHFLIARRRVKAALVTAALNGRLPYWLAGLLIRLGGLRHV